MNKYTLDIIVLIEKVPTFQRIALNADNYGDAENKTYVVFPECEITNISRE